MSCCGTTSTTCACRPHTRTHTHAPSPSQPSLCAHTRFELTPHTSHLTPHASRLTPLPCQLQVHRRVPAAKVLHGTRLNACTYGLSPFGGAPPPLSAPPSQLRSDAPSTGGARAGGRSAVPQHARVSAQARRHPLRSGAPHLDPNPAGFVRPVRPLTWLLSLPSPETGEHPDLLAHDVQDQGDRLRQRVLAPRPALLVCAVASLPSARGGAGPLVQHEGRHVVTRLHPDGAVHGQAAVRQHFRSGAAPCTYASVPNCAVLYYS